MHAQLQPYNVVLRIGAKMLIPLILVFGLYVQFHGEYGPGGGFQAGVIFAAAYILYALVFGMNAARTVAPEGVLRVLAALGLLLYYGVGIVSMFAGGNFLDYSVLAEDGVSGQLLGIFCIELGIGITVASVMMIIFFAFAERGVAR
ncbi:MAG TPA: Na(+)/H(+) antiporter subunit B [Gammaproteobacteria bacterium]|nr:Na(+)/H(+) antiporter subunit B [Gammaproteobacteria bacterium]